LETAESCRDADVVVFQKKYGFEELKFAEALRERSTVTVFDLCDDHFYNPGNLPEVAERAARAQRMIELVDGVSVSTEPMRRLVIGKDTAVVDDAVDELAVRRAVRWRRRLTRRRGDDELRLVWGMERRGSRAPPSACGICARSCPCSTTSPAGNSCA